MQPILRRSNTIIMVDEPKLTMSEKIVAALTDRIMHGQLAPGEKLRQDHIAREFETSHVPVREALLRLEARGLAESLPRRGVRVAGIKATDIREIRAMRLALEPLALRHSVPNLTGAERAEADAARAACDAAETFEDWEAENRRFHLAILAGCKMTRLMAEIGDLQILAARHLLATFSDGWEQRVDRDHHAIMSALAARDGDMAVSVLNRHLSRLG